MVQDGAPDHTMFFRLLQMLADLLFPWRCLRCGREGVLLCAPCAAQLPRTLTRWCPACAMVVDETHRHGDDSCDAYWALVPYHERWVERAVQQMKYAGGVPLARLFGTLIAARVGREVPRSAIVTYVPLHRKRRRERGYDQAAELARAFARSAARTSCTLLKKTRATTTQATLAGDARRSNLRNAFRTCATQTPFAIEGKTVILMDDVVTTGTTLQEASLALRSAGVARIIAVTFAYTAPEHNRTALRVPTIETSVDR